MQRPAADKQRGPRATRGVDRGVGDGNADEMDEREGEPDRERGEASGRLAVGRAHDDEQEHHGQHEFGDRGGGKIVFARRMFAVAIGGEAAGEAEIRFAAGNQIKHAGCDDRADHLGDDIGRNLVRGKASARGEPHGHGGIEMAAGDVADGIGHGDDGKTESECDAEQADADLRKSSGEHGAAASCEGEPEGADCLGGIFARLHPRSPNNGAGRVDGESRDYVRSEPAKVVRAAREPTRPSAHKRREGPGQAEP